MLHLFGIRHHGPGSARSLVHALTELQPDVVLIEGPPDGDVLLPLAADPGLVPPVALLVYVAQDTERAVLYPFASYSPEWQAIQFALARSLPVHFIDLPHALRFGSPRTAAASPPDEDDEDTDDVLHGDPLAPMARAAGYGDAERWWDHLVESRAGHDQEVFAATHEMIAVLRAELAPRESLRERRREAHMRRAIRAADAKGYQRIAVVCGAYHTPALAVLPGPGRPAAALPSAKEDDALLKGLRPQKSAAAWVPWSYERLSYRSGYGAGVESPIWYELLWERRAALGAEWLTRAARLLRAEDVPVSSAHVIEAVRLADALASLRARVVPGLLEYNDAAISVLGAGDARNLQLIERRWHYGERLGKVPETFPAAPLQQDLAALQKRLRFPPRTEDKRYDFDLREPLDRERSRLLRRLRLLEIDWGEPAEERESRGTFHELWTVRWEPEFALALIEASRYGHTLEQAASARVCERAVQEQSSLIQLIEWLDDALFADLPDAVAALVSAIERRAALSSDVIVSLDALTPLVEVQRYGNVRQTDISLIAAILAGLVPRVLIAVPGAAANIDDAAAHALWQKLVAAERALGALGDPEYSAGFREMLARLARAEASHPLLQGYARRLLYDAAVDSFDELSAALSRVLSPGNAATRAAAWVEGFLASSGAILIHDDRLRALLRDWVLGVPAERFVQVLPLLRRTFAQFPPAERRLIGERLRAGSQPTAAETSGQDFDEAAARALLPVLQTIWRRDGG
jgi:hypothetical protein